MAASKHWRQSVESDGIVRLVLDMAESSINTLSREVLEELALELAEIASKNPKGLILASGKSNGFIFGAEIKEFSRVSSAQEGTDAVLKGQELLNQIESLPFPTIAIINGIALGGGLELALACNYRLAADTHNKTLGLPEVRLGIHPGLGGTVRAVRLTGAPVALDLMLTGRSIHPRKAIEIGLIDRIASPEDLDQVAVTYIHNRPKQARAPWYLRVLNMRVLRLLVARALEKKVAKRAPRAHYPAPYAIINLWREYGALDKAAYNAEALSFGKLLVSNSSKNLVRVFFLRERLRNLAPRENKVTRLHVIGAGVMGGDIAAWCAAKGLEVTLQDTTEELVEIALRRARKTFAYLLKAPGEAQAAQNRLTMDAEGLQAGSADIIFEVIVEKLDAKQNLLRTLESNISPDTLIATNTSSIRLEDMAESLEYPERFVGLHFFNPVSRLPLVEVIKGEKSAENSLQVATSFVMQIGKLPLPCKSAPGFLVNRILAPYMMEALEAFKNGYCGETIDAAARNFGMPVGPVELVDRVGLDVALNVSTILQGMSSEKGSSDILRKKVDAGQLGAKTGQGFYYYKNNHAQKQKHFPAPDAQLQDRLIFSMLNQAAACLEESIVEGSEFLDAGIIFGAGFPPFTGGPIKYAQEIGIDNIVERLTQLSKEFGPRFHPHSGWSRLNS
ncbi:MAG: 3-hydroxyacyl-CoA dehydrogenase NAD-binding domain-containing protein [Pseudomonadota bacterium]|nr:3-hydroxyacyl-CoA dehydrogenase NAD-binding domain-containing protein [Pseudomonadota bacterium]